MLTTVMIIKTRALEAPQNSIRLQWLSLVTVLVGSPPLPVRPVSIHMGHSIAN